MINVNPTNRSSQESTPEKRVSRRRWAWTADEGIISSVGLAVGALTCLLLIGAAILTLGASTSAHERARREQVEAVAATLMHAVEPFLADGDLTMVRRLVVSAAMENELSRCRVVLPDGGVIADGDVRGITTRTMPERWPASALEPSIAPRGVIGASRTLVPRGRGPMELQVWKRLDAPVLGDKRAQIEVAALAVAGMCGLWLLYRFIVRRLRALSAIKGALGAASRGQTASDALVISPSIGEEAAAWNALLAERDSLREQVLLGGSAPESEEGATRDAQLSSACDAMWQGLVLIDDRMNIKYANGAAAVLLKTRRDQMLNSDLRKLIEDSAVADALAAVASGSSRQRTTVETSRDGGHASGGAVLRFTARPVRKDDSGAAVVMIEDVTQQRVADDSRNAFVAQATHELRTPLTNIRLYVETLVEDDGKDAQTRGKCLNVIGQEVRRLERIVGDMLSVAEIEAGSMRINTGDVRLDGLFEELEGDYQALATDKEMTLTFSLPPKLPVIHGDRDKLSLALHNLIGNALKYTPVGGKVGVKVEEKEGALVVEVSDNGIGIKEEECNLIFEKFYRAKDKRIAGITGSGLGLALAREVVRMHGGDITVKSAIDKGSTFTLTVPVAGGASTLAKAA